MYLFAGETRKKTSEHIHLCKFSYDTNSVNIEFAQNSIRDPLEILSIITFTKVMKEEFKSGFGKFRRWGSYPNKVMFFHKCTQKPNNIDFMSLPNSKTIQTFLPYPCLEQAPAISAFFH